MMAVTVSVVTVATGGDAAPMRSLLGLFTFIGTLVVTGLLAPVQAQGAPIPWSQDARIGPSGQDAAFTVTAIERKAEFVRLTLTANDGAAVGIEVRADTGPSGPYQTGVYRIQPLPGVDVADGSPLELTIRHVADALREWQKQPGHTPFVRELSGKKLPPAVRQATVQTSTWSTPNDHGWGRHALWLLLQAIVIGLMVWLGGGQAALSIGAGVVAWFAVGEPPIAAIHSLQEAGTGPRIEQLYGHGIHAGPAFDAILHLVTGGAGYGIDNIARLNVALWVSGSGLFAAFALRRTGLWLGAALALVAALNANTLHASVSELPSSWIALHAAGVAFAAVAVGDASQRHKKAWLLLVALAGVLAAGVRPELVVLPVAVFAVVAARTWLQRAATGKIGGSKLAVTLANWPEIRGPRRRWMVRHSAVALAVMVTLTVVTPLVVVPILKATLASVFAGSSASHWGYLVRALDGSELVVSLLWLPGFLVGTAMPVGVGLLLLWAVVRTIARPWATLGLGAATLLLYRVYFVAGHGISLDHYELYRYATVFAPLAMLLTVDVVADLRDLPWIVNRSPSQRRALFAVFAASLCIFPSGTSDYTPTWPKSLVRNQQLEVRALLALTRKHPDCAFVAPVLGSKAEGQHSTDAMVFGLRGGPVNPARYSPPWEQLRSDLAHVDCRLAYKGLDCSAGLIDCGGWFGGEALDRFSWQSAPYLADHFYPRPLAGQLEISVHPLRFPPAKAPTEAQ